MKSGKRLGFLGAGNMAQALIKGVLEAKLYRASEIRIADLSSAQRRRVQRRFGVTACASNAELVRSSRVIVLAVKPQVLPAVLEEVKSAADSRSLFVSIAAGVPMKKIEDGLGGCVRLIRVMPNTPALVGRGMSVMVRGRRASRSDLSLAMTLFRGVGDAVAVADEGLIDPVTGLSGSGPAYVYRFAEALIEGGVREGLTPALASRLALQTIAGAATMLQQTKQTPRQLREMVSSPGGTTLAGLASLEKASFVEMVCTAIHAATERSRELGIRAMEAK
jgi:pyrroline-5-carboxylate reductase